MTRRLAAVVPFVLLALPVLAQDIIIDDPPPDWRRPQPWGIPVLDISSYEVSVDVRDQAAHVSLDATFHNPGQALAEGHFLMNLPRGAAADQFSMTVNGEEHTPELIDANQARQIYESYVRRYIDPGLLEMAGDGLLRARVYPIPANGDISIHVSYRAVLERRGESVELRLPLARWREGSEPVGRVAARVELASSDPIGNVYSPSHSLTIARPDATRADVSFESQGYTDRRDLTIYYTVSQNDVGLTMLTYKPDGEDGYFMLLASPRIDLPEDVILPRDFVFAIDRSGSMRGPKFQQARDAIRYCVDHLREIDRFNVVDYASEAHSFRPGLVEANEENRRLAGRYLDEMTPGGGTNIDAALTASLAMFSADENRVPMLFFSTDGLPTVGTRDFAQLVQLSRDRNQANVRIFAFGVGTDVNTSLLDRMADAGNGARDYVLPEENIEERVSLLYNKTSSPVLTNVSLDGGGLDLYDIQPQRLRDVYRGDQVVIVGRFRQAAPGAITMAGTAGGEAQRYTIEIAAPTEDGSLDFLPRIWAARRIEWLIDQARLSPEANEEVVQEIVELSRRFGIVTPYTSYLITEDQPMPQPQVWEDAVRRGLGDLRDRAEQSGGGDGGINRQAVEESRRFGRAQEPGAPAPTAAAVEAESDELLGENAREILRRAGDRAFYNHDGVWTDSLYDAEGMADGLTTVAAGSDEYIALLRDHPEAARLVVGLPTILVLDGRAYRITAPEN